MPFPALLATLLPMLGSAAATGLGSYFAGKSGQPGAGQPYGSGDMSGGLGMLSQRGPSGDLFSSMSNLSPQQQQMQGNLLSQLGPLLQGLQSKKFDFGPIAEEARTQFQEKTVPSIAERFTSMGQGGQSTEAFKRSLGTAGAGLEQGLASQKQLFGLQQQGLQQQLLSSILGGALSPSRESFVTPAKPSFLESLMGGLSQSAATYGPSLAMRYLGNRG